MHAVNWEAIGAIGQVVGAVAVVISLIYLAREVRRNTGATHLTAMRSMHDAYNHWIQLLAQYPDLNDLYNRGIHDFESLKGADLVGFSMLMDQLFYIYQEMYYQQLEGHLDQRVWDMTEVPLHDINAYPGVQAW